MPTELRRILFTRDELADALADYARAGARRWPEGEIRSVRMDPRSDGTLSLEVREDDPVGGGGVVRVVRIEPEWVAAALIKFCADRGIVLPKQAQKSLELLGDTVSLNIVIQARTLLKIIGERKPG